MPTLVQISELARAHAETRGRLAFLMGALEGELMKLRRERLPEIRKALAKAQEQRDRLVTAVTQSPELFEKPKTQVFHGIRIGFQKAKGTITWDDEENVIKLIWKHFPDLAETLLKTTEKPIKSALANLTASDLKKLGVQVVENGEEVVIRPMDGELDKLIDRLLETTATLD